MAGVVVVDDQAPFRRTVKAVLSATPGFELLAEAISGEAAVALARSLDPDLVLMDIRMPGIGGIEAARRISGSRGGTLVVLVSSYPEQNLAADAGACGAAAYIPKERFGSRVLEDVWRLRAASGAARTEREARP